MEYAYGPVATGPFNLHPSNFSLPLSSARLVLSNTVVQLFGKLATAVLAIITLKLISSYLGTTGYGEYTTVYEFLAFFGIVGDFGIFQIAVKEMSAHPEDRHKIFGNIFAIRSVLVLLAMLLAVGTGYLIPKYTGTKIPAGILIASVTTLITILFGTLSSLLQVALRMQWSVVGLVAGKIVTLLYMFVVVYFWLPHDLVAGFYQLLVAGIVGGIVMLAVTYFAARKVEGISLQFDWHFWKVVLLKALPYGAAILLATVYFRIGAILLSLLRDSEEVGLYGVAARILENLNVISVFFLNSTLPIMARLFRDNSEKLRQLLQYSFDFLVLISLPIVVGGVTLAFPLVAAISSPEFLSNFAQGFYGSDVALQILLFSMFFAFLANLFGYTLLAGNQQIKLLYINLAAVVVNITSNLIVIPIWGLRGAAATSVVSQALVCILGLYFVKKMITIRFHHITLLKASLAAAIMGLTIYYLQEPLFTAFGGNQSLLVLIPIGGVIYGITLLVTKAVTPEMWGLVKKQG